MPRSLLDAEVLRRDGADDLLGAGLAAGDLQEGRLAELDEAFLDGLLPQGAGGLALGDHPAELAGDPHHLEDADPAGVAGLVAFRAALGGIERLALAGLEPGADLVERRGHLAEIDPHLAGRAEPADQP